MFIFNGRKFAKNAGDFSESLFNKGGTSVGFYKKVKIGIRLYDVQNNLIAFIRFSDYFLMSAKKLDDGKIWFSYPSSMLERFLGLECDRSSQSSYFAREALLNFQQSTN